MAEKKISKHLMNLEKQFASENSVLQKASQVFQELDQVEYDMGLIDQEETNARKTSWWPIISTLGGYSSAKNDFINRYFGTHLQSSSHKFTVHQYTPHTPSATIPGTALNADHRLPFYQISHDIEKIAPGEGSKVNSYIELVTDDSAALHNKLLIDTPVLSTIAETGIAELLHRKVIEISDLVLVFTDLFDADPALINDTVDAIKAHQDSNKFVYIIDHSAISLDQNKIKDIIASWRKRLAALDIHTGQFIVLTDAGETTIIDERINNLENDRTYRVLSSLENSIKDINDVIFPEVGRAIALWKDRVHTTILIVLGLIATLIVFAEISIGGMLDLLFDPIFGTFFILILLSFLTPLHLVVSRVHAKFITENLLNRQRELLLNENLSGMFEKNLGVWRTLLPLADPVDKTKKTRRKLTDLLEQCKDLVQTLNDQFSHYQPDKTPPTQQDNF